MKRKTSKREKRKSKYGKFGPPNEPAIPPSECSAALKLAERMFDNIRQSGDVPYEVLAWVVRVGEESERLRKKLLVCSDEDSNAVIYAIYTQLLPTCHYGGQSVAGKSLVDLIAVAGEYGWFRDERPTAKSGPVSCADRLEAHFKDAYDAYY